MEALAALGILALVGVVIAPFVALGLVIGARKRLLVLEREVEARKDELRYLYEQLKQRNAARESPVEQHTAPARPATTTPAIAPPPEPAPAPAHEPAPAPDRKHDHEYEHEHAHEYEHEHEHEHEQKPERARAP